MFYRGFEDFRIYLLCVFWHSNKWGVTTFQTLFGLLSASCQPLWPTLRYSVGRMGRYFICPLLLASYEPLRPTQQYSVVYLHDQPEVPIYHLLVSVIYSVCRNVPEVCDPENHTICWRTCSLWYHLLQNMFFMVTPGVRTCYFAWLDLSRILKSEILHTCLCMIQYISYTLMVLSLCFLYQVKFIFI